MEILKRLAYRRKKSGLTQANVADQMQTTASAIARLESGGGKKKHSPSLRTLKMYANSIGCDIEINLIPLIKLKNEVTV